MSTPPGEATPCLLVLTDSGIGADSGLVAERAARAAGLEPRLIASKLDCADRLVELRGEARNLGLRTLAIHTEDWGRQSTQQFFEVVAARLGLPDRRIVVGDGRRQIALTRWRLARRLAALPVEVALGLGLVALERGRFVLGRGSRAAPRRRSGAEITSVLAVWRGSPGYVAGGAVTHIAGILGAFRRTGMRVGLLTAAEPPEQLGSVVDDVEILPALPARARATRDIELVVGDRTGLAAGRRLAERLGPGFVYQRHGAFTTHGVQLAREADVPFVLEWNASEAWTRAHWNSRRLLSPLFDGLAVNMERRVVEQASLIAAVSEEAAGMAREAGASEDRLLVVPNGVDLDDIDASLAGVSKAAAPGAPRVGWVGSFGPWHGVEILMRAVPMLPAEVQVVMIGDGAARRECEALAEELGVAERITWTGLLPHREAVRRLAECDVLASPHVSTNGRPFFGSPTKTFEYMAIGRPIVASALEQLSEVLEDGRTARLVEPASADALAGGIRDVLELPDRGAALGRAARAEAEDRHTWDRRARVILDRLQSGDQPVG